MLTKNRRSEKPENADARRTPNDSASFAQFPRFGKRTAAQRTPQKTKKITLFTPFTP
jgi:hypothetical protein